MNWPSSTRPELRFARIKRETVQQRVYEMLRDKLMRGNFDRLAAGAAEAGRQARSGLGQKDDDSQLSILVSCIGRRLLMGQRTVDEAEAAGAELGPDGLRLGFYSYGEISPHRVSGVCELHNQTMTVTTIAEATENAGA